MLNSYNINKQTLSTNQVATFEVDSTKTGCTVMHTPGTGTFYLSKPGFYMVHLNASGAVSNTVGNITLAAYANGDAIPGAVSTSYSDAATTDIVNLSLTTIVQVRPSCPIVSNTIALTIVNTGEDTILNNINLVITKIA